MFSKRKEQVERFNRMLEMANGIAASKPSALPDLVRLLGRPVQSALMAEAAMKKLHGTNREFLKNQLLFDRSTVLTQDGRDTDSLIRQLPEMRDLRLGVDLIFTQPWHRERLSQCLSAIGVPPERKPWKYDRINHFIEYWLPMGIGWVNGGNHSIAVGITRAEGHLPPSSTYDISPLFEHVHTDGWWYHSKVNPKFCKVRNVEMAAIFEIGRLMHQHGVTA